MFIFSCHEHFVVLYRSHAKLSPCSPGSVFLPRVLYFARSWSSIVSLLVCMSALRRQATLIGSWPGICFARSCPVFAGHGRIIPASMILLQFFCYVTDMTLCTLSFCVTPDIYRLIFISVTCNSCL